MSDEWRKRAACRGMDTKEFYPAIDDTLGRQAAQQVCQRCPVRLPCLDDAIADTNMGPYGIRGGLDESQRKRLRKNESVEQRRVSA